MVIEIKIKAPPVPRNLLGRAPQTIISAEARLAVKRGSTIMLRAARVAASTASGRVSVGWTRLPIRRRGLNIEGGIVNRVANKGQSIAAVLEKGARRHFPPVGQPGQEPALADWIRRSGVAFTVTEMRFRTKDNPKGKKVTLFADKSNLRQLKKVAYTIGRGIKQRGFPRRGIRKKVFSRKILGVRRKINQEFFIMQNRIAAKLVAR